MKEENNTTIKTKFLNTDIINYENFSIFSI